MTWKSCNSSKRNSRTVNLNVLWETANGLKLLKSLVHLTKLRSQVNLKLLSLSFECALSMNLSHKVNICTIDRFLFCTLSSSLINCFIFFSARERAR